MAFDPAYSDAISNIESGGKYGILGPVTRSGDRAYGKYQVMGSNIGPWSKEILGLEMSPQDFLANPQAQEAVFQGKFGQYVDKYGPEGAAQAWFGGPGAVGKTDRKDMLGTSVGQYGQRFMAGLGRVSQPTQQPINAPAAISGPQIPQQLASLTPSNQETPSAQVPQQGPIGGIFQPQPVPQELLSQIPRLAGPNPALRQAILANAFSRLPVPAGFRGYSRA